MNLFFLIAKIAIVAFFLIMFLRSSKTIWGIGLLTVTSAILLDTFLGTFGQEEMIEQLGFFFYVFAGALFAGAAVWLVGVVWPHLRSEQPDVEIADRPESEPADPDTAIPSVEPIDLSQAPSEHQALFEHINNSFTKDNIQDLTFDMRYVELLQSSREQDEGELLRTVFERAEKEGQSEELGLAVERIQNPLPPDHLPRIEKITTQSPPTVLRQYLVQNCSNAELESIAANQELDWEFDTDETINRNVRNLLLNVQNSNKTEELIGLLQVRSQDNP